MVIIDKILRSLFGVIDGLFAWATGVLYTLIVQIANVDIFGNYIYEFMGRIYVYLSIFMLFKLSISVVNYVLNPDQLTDKSKGFGKLIQNVIIVIALIIMVPTIFDWAYKLQSTILNTNVLYTVVTGKKNDSNYDPTEFSNMSDEKKVEAITKESDYAGDMIKYQIMSSFIYSEDDKGKQISAIRSSNAECENQSSYKDKYDCLMSGDTINNTSQKKFGFTKKGFTNEYKFLISTICIGFTAYLFLVFAFDVALRCVKLGALQLIAPIPIISMLDPNSGKNGMFSKWLKECTKTYTSLFIRLIGVYFAIEIIKSMTEEGRFVWRGTETQVGFGFVKIFIILGLLMFAKQLPQFIETITGVKLDGGGLNLKKKVGDIPLAGKPINKATGFVGRSAANLGKMGARYAGRAVSGLDNRLGGHGHNLVNRAKVRADAMHNRYRQFVDAHPLIQDLANTTAGIGLDAQQTVGFDPMKKLEDKRQKIADVQKQASDIMSRAGSEMMKYDSMSFIDSNGNSINISQLKAEKERLEILRNSGVQRRDYTNDTDYQRAVKTRSQELAALQTYINKTEKEAAKTYVDQAVSLGDTKMESMVNGLKNTVSRSSVDEVKGLDVSNGNAINGVKGNLDATLSSIDSQINDRRELIRKQNENKKK